MNMMLHSLFYYLTVGDHSRLLINQKKQTQLVGLGWPGQPWCKLSTFRRLLAVDSTALSCYQIVSQQDILWAPAWSCIFNYPEFVDTLHSRTAMGLNVARFIKFGHLNSSNIHVLGAPEMAVGFITTSPISAITITS